MTGERDADVDPNWEDFDNRPSHWQFPRDDADIRIAQRAMSGFLEHDLKPFVEYLIESKALSMPLSMRRYLIGLLIGGPDWEMRLTLTKHPELKRAPKPMSYEDRQQSRAYEAGIIFIKNGGLEKYEAGIQAVMHHFRIPRGSATPLIRHEQRKRAIEARELGLPIKYQIECYFDFVDLEGAAWQAKRDELSNKMEAVDRNSEEAAELLLRWNSHMLVSPYRRY